MTPDATEPLTFEKALAELERILRNLEDGSTSLEESLAQYERGVGLLKGCYQRLRDAEQRILKVAGVDEAGKPLLEIFEHSATLEAVPEANRGSTSRKRKTGEGTAY